MSQYEKESLSALLDNAADDLELRRLLVSCESNPELMRTWERYNLAQSLLHDSGVAVSATLSERIQQELEAEPTPRAVSGLRHKLSKMAIAASVALVVIVGFRTSLNDNMAPALVQQDTTSAGEQDRSGGSGGSGGSGESPVAETADIQVDPEAQQRLLDFIRSVSFDEEEPVRIEHIQDSPLYRLVNDLQENPDPGPSNPR